ncbi:MAG: Ger(x)C family spore germination protein, partial [Clostridia bacterium]|nr:Ger(x)C family spore germination protein [Clostridia bacterium]
MKNVCLAALLAAALLVLPGCWNYKEVEEYDIVAGFAIDKGTGENKYKLTIDVVNISSKDVRPVTRILECEGKTLFDAIRIASRRDPSKLLWSHMQIAIVSEEVAREDIAPIVKLLITDAEPRLKLEILVSAEKTAGEILTSGGQPKSILSYDMNKELDSNDKLTGTTASNSELYQIYNKLGTKGTALT